MSAWRDRLGLLLGGRRARRRAAEAAEAQRRDELAARRRRPERDPSVGADELLARLAVYAELGEVLYVRQQVLDGAFTLDQLDDLVRHRRAQQLSPRRGA